MCGGTTTITTWGITIIAGTTIITAGIITIIKRPSAETRKGPEPGPFCSSWTHHPDRQSSKW